MGRVMVNLTSPNSYPHGGRTWAIAFIGIAGDLPLLVADGEGLLPKPSKISRTLADGDYNSYPGEDTLAYWPSDSAALTVREAQRGESLAEAEARGDGRASGTVDITFDIDGDGVAPETVTISVHTSGSEVQAALLALGGFLAGIEVSTDFSKQRARNGGENARVDPICTANLKSTRKIVQVQALQKRL